MPSLVSRKFRSLLCQPETQQPAVLMQRSACSVRNSCQRMQVKQEESQLWLANIAVFYISCTIEKARKVPVHRSVRMRTNPKLVCDLQSFECTNFVHAELRNSVLFVRRLRRRLWGTAQLIKSQATAGQSPASHQAAKPQAKIQNKFVGMSQ